MTYKYGMEYLIFMIGDGLIYFQVFDVFLLSLCNNITRTESISYKLFPNELKKTNDYRRPLYFYSQNTLVPL